MQAKIFTDGCYCSLLCYGKERGYEGDVREKTAVLFVNLQKTFSILAFFMRDLVTLKPKCAEVPRARLMCSNRLH